MDPHTLTTYAHAVAHRLPWGDLTLTHNDVTRPAVQVIEDALREAATLGLLVGTKRPEPPTRLEVDHAAQFLAAVADHPRYADAQWRAVLASRVNLDHVARAARERVQDRSTLDQINAAHALLLMHMAGWE